MLILGVDPGFTGALCLMDQNGAIRILDTPLMAAETLTSRALSSRSVDVAAIARWLEPHSCAIELVVIEKVNAAPDQGVSSTFRFGESYGQVQGILAGLSINRVIKTPPAVWKAKMAVTHNKQTSLDMARKLAPEYAHLFSRKKDDGRAEAFLLAIFGARSLGWPHTGISGERLNDIL